MTTIHTSQSNDSGWAWVFLILLLMAGFGPLLFWLTVPLALIFVFMKLGARASRWLRRLEATEAESSIPVGVCVIVSILLLAMFGGPVLLAVLR